MSTPNEAHPVVESIEQLVRSCEIVDVVFYASSAARLDEGPAVPPAAEDLKENSPAMQVMQQKDDRGISTRIRCSLRTPDGFYYVDVAARYEYTIPGTQVNDEIAKEFAERVGVMAVYPYLRQELYALSAKMRLGTPLLGFLRPGDISLERENLAAEPTPQG